MREMRDSKSSIFAAELARHAARHGLKIASAGTHPFSHWMDQLITADERYTTIVKDMQQIARVCLTFGLHVHVGIPDREEGIDIMNQARYFLPTSVCALGQLAFLAGTKHRAQSVSANDF